MRRILVMLAAAAAVASLGAGAAMATPEDGSPPADPSTATTTSATDTDTTQSNFADQISMIIQSGSIVYICMSGATCGDAILVNQANVTQIIYQCNTTAANSCVIIASAPAAAAAGAAGTATEPEDNVFLCYSDYQVNPGVWPYSQAIKLRAQGYWEPAAVWGNVYKGTNVGDFHLVCNVEGATEGNLIGDDGSVLTEADVGYELGYYPVIVG